MRYRRLGDTGLTVSELSFGTIPILSGDVPVLPAYHSPDEETAVAVMYHAWKLGCNLYDTAIVPEYGDAEIKLGKFAAAVGREHLIISDKARYFDGNGMYQAVLESACNLDTYPDIYFVHQVDESNEDAVFGPGGALEALCELKAEGKIRFCGIASHYYRILQRGAADKRVDVLQGSGNLLERGMLDRIEKDPQFKGKGLLLNKVYAAGILPAFFPVRTLISGVLTYPVSSALIGMGTFAEVDQAMGQEPPVAKRPDFCEIITELAKYVSPLPCDRCQRCRCPYGTEIHILLRQYNYYHLGKDYWALRKLDLGIRESAARCRSCTSLICMKQCPRHIRIPFEIERIEKLVEAHIRDSLIINGLQTGEDVRIE